MKITLYWVSRERTGHLGYSISSFIQNAKNPNLIEVIVAADEDDSETEKALNQINDCVHFISGNNITFLQTKRHGYEYIDRYVNEAGKLFSTDCFITLCDDMICDTNGWDEILLSSLEKSLDKPTFIWIDCDANNYKFPGVISLPKMPRVWGVDKKWYNKTKHFIGWRAGDDYFMNLLDEVKDYVNIIYPKFQIHNLRKENDQTFEEGRNWAKQFSKRGPKEDDTPGDFKQDVQALKRVD